MSAPEIHLEVFEGPLDLLMHLIRKNNLDIYDIPISRITGEYLEYLEVMKSLNLEVAGEFLVMASTLMQIKAKMLLPSKTDPETGEAGPDPRAELAQKLEEYQRYKQASKTLESRFAVFKDAFYRGSPVFASDEKFLDLELYSFLDAVKRAFERVEGAAEVEGESFPIETRVAKILDLLKGREWLLLDDVFATETKKMGVITCFIALLELIKQRKIYASQDDSGGEVRIYAVPEPGAGEAAAGGEGAAPGPEGA